MATSFPQALFFLVLMLFLARVGALVERLRQPAVLGELLMGVLLGALALAPGFGVLNALKADHLIAGIAEIGVVLLLFRTGLESNLGQMRRVGFRAALVATVGVTVPFVGGYFVSKWLMPELASSAWLFIGAALTATSVGITARVFSDLGAIRTPEAQIVLGAAVIDDIMGLLILAVVAGVVSTGSVSIGSVAVLSLKALVFLAVSIALGRVMAPRLGDWFSRIHGGAGMKMAVALLFCGAYAYGASTLAGLAPIVGAFAAGLVLDAVHFKTFSAPHLAERIREWAKRTGPNVGLSEEMRQAAAREEDTHVEQLIDGVSNFFVPIFFVYTGLQVNLSAFSDPATVGIALVVTAVAFAGKILCGWAAGKGVDRMLIGFGMVPRGEVGLIFANVGKALGVVNDRVFAIVVVMIILSTLCTPPILSALVRRKKLV